jgi:hypothetical protein
MNDEETPRTDHPAGGVNLPLPGIQTANDIQAAQEHLIDPETDPETNELHAAGWTCARCGQTIRPEDDVRRTLSGAYQHEVCELP